ncbi:CHRNA7-FAM7A fusion protein-like [Haliotis rubra]|uniref:CHRNA7-FAM7A fusion protein-like n=1 Tax=Haliotis rubra TaxID=36100 RepID=UPI001EE51BBB|nr:CHRNA7-FAM7A fusion protein-like [Haliotis rubra]
MPSPDRSICRVPSYECQNALEYTRSKVDYVFGAELYMALSDMLLRMNQVVGYNNEIVIATADQKLGLNPEVSNASRVVPHYETGIVAPAPEVEPPPRQQQQQQLVEVNDISSSRLNNAILESSGNVGVPYQVILKTSCYINVASFPMDQQQCRMTFESWTYHGNQLNISNGERGEASLSEYISNAEWELISFTKNRQVTHYSCCLEPYITLTYTVTMRRRPLFFLMYLMMPCLIITLVALLGLLVPTESGEKVSIGITSLLSMIALLLVISTLLPPTSLAIPLIGWYYAINIVIVSLSIVLAVFTLNIHQRGARGHKLPRSVKTFFFRFLARILFIKIDLPESTDQNMILISAHDEAMDADKPASTMTEGQPGGGNNVVDVLNRLLNTVEKAMDLHKRRITTQDSLDEATYEWKQLAIVLERALTIIFLIVTLCTACVMFTQTHW